MDNSFNHQIDVVVIIPVYNGEKFLNKAIESVLAQPCQSIDLVLVDDGSRDSTPILCDQWAENNERIHVIHKFNGGVSSARNTGIEYALSQLEIHENTYIAFLDADDVWCRDVFNCDLFNILQEGIYDLIQFPYFIGDSSVQQGRLIPLVENTIEYNSDGTAKPVRFTGSFCSCLYSCGVLRKYRIEFPEGIKHQEDAVFFFILSGCCQTFLRINRPIFVYRSNPSSAVHRKANATSVYLEHVIPAWEWVAAKITELYKLGYPHLEHDISACEVMKRVYLSEYISVACQEGISIRKIQATIEQAGYAHYCTANNILIGEKEAIFTDFIHRPLTLWIINRIKGLTITLAKCIKSFPLIKKLRYPTNIQQYIT